jgi:hypothetical protein
MIAFLACPYDGFSNELPTTPVAFEIPIKLSDN